MKPHPFTFALICSFLVVNSYGQIKWPKSIPFPRGGSVTLYQPQPESMSGNSIKGRSAISVKETSKSDPVFGAIFYDAFISTDKDNRIASLDSIVIQQVKITGIDDSVKLKKLATLLETEIPKWKMEIALDALVATIKYNYPDPEIYNNDPPKVYYRSKPTTLVYIDGEPKTKKDTDIDAERVLNTPSLIFKEGSQWNLYTGGVWYKSNSITSGWTPETTMSDKVKSINDQIKKHEKENNNGKEPSQKPKPTEILVSTEPAEVIQSDGPAEYKDIDGTSLSYISNSSNNIFKDKNSQSFYILLAGRWYKSSSLDGPWTFNEPDKLPADFSKIPEGSEKDVVLAHVSGTKAADEAIVDNEIPQTAKIERKTPDIKVGYDGTPKFTTIKGTNLALAENSASTVFREGEGKYYVLENGVWYTGRTSTGPWSVAIERPAEVEKIPMQSKAYSAKFVYIYEVTDTYTIQGYTGGYLGSYVQGDPVIVFGTGFYYPAWYGAYYYPAPLTWGYGFVYTPWVGWGMAYPYAFGYMSVGFYFGFGFGYGYGYGWGCGGWYGPHGYRPPYYGHHPGHGYYGRNGNRVNHHDGLGGRNNVYRDRPTAGTSDRPNAGGRPSMGTNDRPGAGSGNRPSATPANGKNNVFADQAGNAFQQRNNGTVNQRDNASNSWKSASDRTSPGASNNINRDMQSRGRSDVRTNNYQNYSRGSGGGYGGGSRGGGGRGGGGGRRG